MLFLLDANVLIEANRKYYSLDRVPEFWEWFIHVAADGQVKIPIDIYEEIAEGNDDLAMWARRDDVKATIVLNEELIPCWLGVFWTKDTRQTLLTMRSRRLVVIHS